MQRVPSLVAGVPHYMRQSAYMHKIEAVVAHCVPFLKKIFRARGASASYLERHELLCLYSLLDVATTLEAFKLKEHASSRLCT